MSDDTETGASAGVEVETTATPSTVDHADPAEDAPARAALDETDVMPAADAATGAGPDVPRTAVADATDFGADLPGEDAAGADDAADRLVDDEEDGFADDADFVGETAEAPRAIFADLGLSEPILRAVAESGYLTPTPIQEQAIPVILTGRDVLGCAQTGTGKTAGFTLPMLDILASGRAKARMPRSLILEPTRELALQVAENFVKYGAHLKLVHALLIGGESMEEQTNALTQGVDVLIATPGRLLDLFERGRILLADCRILVIDEADRMLDMGFIPDVERIVSLLPKTRQTLFFSATMAPEIRRLSDAFLQNPKEITVSLPATVATTIVAGLVWVRDHDKREALRRMVRQQAVQNALIFCNRKVEVDVLYKSLKKHGFSVGALHGDMDQPSRFATLNKFKANELQLLVCSDVAARGLDIGGLSHVFNFDVPYHAEDYVHRIGRTGRAGREGHAFTIAMLDDVRSVAAIEKLTGKPIPRIAIDGLDVISNEELAEAATSKRSRGRGGRPSSAPSREPTPREAASRGGGTEPRAGGDPRRSRGGGARDSGRREEPRRPEARTDARPESRPDARATPRPEERRPETGRPEGQRDDRAREARPARPDIRPPQTRREEAPREEYRREEPRRDDPRRRERDDMGPSVRGFGDALPAFMLIPIPRRVREAPVESNEEAAAA